MLTFELQYFYFPETNGWKLETLDNIFAEAWENKENPVFTEKRWRKGKNSDVEAPPASGSGDEGPESGDNEVKVVDARTEKREDI